MKHIDRILISAALVLIATAAAATEIIEAPLTSPRAQDSLESCGAAAIQTILQSYPNPTTSCTSALQADIDGKLGLPENQGQGFFHSDADGVANVLNNATGLFGCPPASAHWVVFTQPDASVLTYQMTYFMKKYKYPVAVLYKTSAHNVIGPHREHWVTVYRFKTGGDPFITTSIALDTVQYISQLDELSINVVDNIVDAASWLADFQIVAIPTAKYDGKYVAVIEPPKQSGKVRVVPFAVTGTPISADRALTEAARFVRTLDTNPRFRDLTTLRPQKPLLVNPERGGYFVVPFARGDEAPTAAVILNAYNGRFMKVGRFPPQPMQSEREAIGRALRYLGRDSAAQIRTSLVALPSDGTTYFPKWRVVADGQEVLVAHDGRIPTDTSRCGGDLQKTIATGAPSGWTLVSGPGVAAPMQPVVVTPVPSWASVPGASWVSVDAQRGSRGGDYVYETEFCLCATAKNPRMTLTFLADNGAKVLLNGKQIYATTGNTNFQSPIKSLGYAGTPADWVIPGTNRVQVIVNNESSVTGLAASLVVKAEGGACPGRD